MKFLSIDERLSDYDRIRQLLKIERETKALDKVKQIVDFLKMYAINLDIDHCSCRMCDAKWANQCDNEYHKEGCILHEL